MRIAYVNANLHSNHTGGGFVHIEQFISNAIALGHEIWVYPRNQFPGVSIIPTDHIGHIKTMRKMDALYVRLEQKPPNVCSWALPPRRHLYRLPLVVWEFNTIPDEVLMRGESEKDVQKYIDLFRHYGRGCDLAICMTKPLAEYVQEKLGIQRVLIVPNGSDSDQFRPDLLPVKRMEPFKDKFNVVWIGSAKIAYHDFEMLRNAAQIVWDRGVGDHINFHIIGPGLVAEMADMPPNVFYWGAETYKRMPNWLAAMDIGLYLTCSDLTQISTPLKFFDYLASGLAVVSTSQPTFIKDLFSQLDQSDLLVPPGDASSLADVLIKLSNDRDRVHRLGMAGREQIIDRYNWRRSVKDTMDEMETILIEKGGHQKLE